MKNARRATGSTDLPWEVGAGRSFGKRRAGLFVIWLTGTIVFSGCQKEKAKEAEAKPPEVFIEQPYEHLVTEKEEFTGMTMAVETIEIRARVSGYLDKNFFKDGDLVREGALLFQIDDR